MGFTALPPAQHVSVIEPSPGTNTQLYAGPCILRGWNIADATNDGVTFAYGLLYDTIGNLTAPFVATLAPGFELSQTAWFGESGIAIRTGLLFHASLGNGDWHFYFTPYDRHAEWAKPYAAYLE